MRKVIGPFNRVHVHIKQPVSLSPSNISATILIPIKYFRNLLNLFSSAARAKRSLENFFFNFFIDFIIWCTNYIRNSYPVLKRKEDEKKCVTPYK